MPVTSIQRMVCNCCGDEAERDLFDKSPSTWTVFKIKIKVDERKKVIVAVCAVCAGKIAELVGKGVVAPEPPLETPPSPKE